MTIMVIFTRPSSFDKNNIPFIGKKYKQNGLLCQSNKGSEYRS
jgi:hypothetical protein